MAGQLTANQFADFSIQTGLLRKRSLLRWGAYPPDVIPLTAAEPDFPAPDVVTDTIIRYLAEGHYPYPPPEGLPELRELISDVAHTRYGITTTPAHIVLAPGTAAAIWGVVRLLCQPGSECILLDPVDLLFGQAVDAAGARPVYCPMDMNSGHLDPDRLVSLISPNTSLICLCNPHNPLGSVFPEETLRAIAGAAAVRGVPILSDEVWNEIVYPPAAHTSIARLTSAGPPKVYTLNGPSKAFALPGLRIGFVIASSPQDAERLRLVFHSLGAAYALTPLSQVGLIAALRDGWAWQDAFTRHLRQLRDYCLQRLNTVPGVSCSRPDATFVLFPDISATGLTSQQMADLLLAKARVAVVPGTKQWFGPAADGHIRISYATSKTVLEDAFGRIEDALVDLQDVV